MTSVTFTPAAVKSKVLASLHRHEKGLKSCMSYKIVYFDTRDQNGRLAHCKCKNVVRSGGRGRQAEVEH